MSKLLGCLAAGLILSVACTRSEPDAPPKNVESVRRQALSDDIRKFPQLNREACLSSAAGGSTNFDHGICRCTTGNYTINPLNEEELQSCAEYAKLKASCLSRGSELTRYLEDEIYEGRLKSACLCVPKGVVMRSYGKDEGDFDNEVKECQQAQAKVLAWSKKERDERLAYYISKLPADVELMVDTTSQKSVDAFLNPSTSGRSVKVVGKKKGYHGAPVFAFRRNFDNRKWLDGSDPVGQQGDPRAGALALGSVVGPYFGFEKIDEDTYTAPSLEEFNRSIAAINDSGEVVAGRGVTVVGQFGAEDYVHHFAKDGSLPASEFLPSGDQTYYFHDLSLHLVSIILFPPEIYNALRSNSARVWNIAQKWISASGVPEVIKKEMMRRVAEGLTSRIDACSVRSLQALYDIGEGVRKRHPKSYEYVYMMAYGDGLMKSVNLADFGEDVSMDFNEFKAEAFASMGAEKERPFSEEVVSKIMDAHLRYLQEKVQRQRMYQPGSE